MKLLGYNINFSKTPISAKTEDSSPKRKNSKIVKIAKSFKDNSRKDIDSWRNALLAMQNPEEPRYDLYHDLIDDLLSDGHLKSQIQMRKMSTLNSPFHSYNRKTKKTNEETTDLLNQKWFYKYLNFRLDYKLKGYTIVEFSEFLEKSIELGVIPRRNVVPTQSRIIPDLENPDQFIDYSNDYFKTWLIELGEKEDLGILNDIIPNLIWLKNVFQSWAEFCEKFGQPLITATTNTTDTTTIENVHKMLLEIGEASVGTFPQGTEIKFHEASRTDAYNTFLQFIRVNQDIVSKRLVGSTMLSDQGSNRSQTEVHERGLDNKIAAADKREIEFDVNDQLFPLLRKHGYNIPEDDRFEFKNVEEKIKQMDLWLITEGLLNSGHEIEIDWLSETFNIPIESKKKISKVVASLENDLNINNSKYPASCCSEYPTAIGKKIQQILKALTGDLIKNIYDKKDVKKLIAKLITAEALEFLTGLRENFTTTSPYIGEDLLALQMMEYNVFEFAAHKTEARLAATTDLLIDPETNKIRSFSKFKEVAEKQMKVFNTSYLLTEYNLTVATGQNSANYLRFLKEKDSVTNLVEYQTVGDDAVRASHRILDGIILDLNDSDAMDLVAPNGYGCRCEFVQYLGDKLPMKGTEAKDLLMNSDGKYRGSQFEMNRANLKQVFTKKQFYNSNKTTEEIVNKLSYKDFGAKPYSSFKKDLKPIKLDKTITSKNAKDFFKNNAKPQKNQFMGFEDYLKRKMILNKSLFDSKTKKDITAQAFPHIKNTLSNPSEVWYSSDSAGTFSSKYMTFFKDQILVIETEIDPKKGLEIKDWYFKSNDKNLRTGLKIK